MITTVEPPHCLLRDNQHNSTLFAWDKCQKLNWKVWVESAFSHKFANLVDFHYTIGLDKVSFWLGWVLNEMDFKMLV